MIEQIENIATPPQNNRRPTSSIYSDLLPTS